MDITIIVGFEDEVCIECGVTYWMPSTLNKQRMKDKKTFYCPNGHGQSYSESLSDKLQKQLDAKKAELLQIQRDNADLGYERTVFLKKIEKLEAKLKRVKKVKGA